MKMYSLFLSVFQISIIFISRVDSIEKPEPLCENPIIHSADRLINGTVRLYRDNYYWELLGLPDKEGMLFGPFKIWYQNFAPINVKSSVLTCIECNRKGFIYKFEGLKWWAWEPSGRQWKGGSKGEDFKYLPTEPNSNFTGFSVVFHNGQPQDQKVIGISGDRTFYYSTKGYYIEPAKGYDTKGYVGGKDGENLPTDITAGLSWPSGIKDQYMVYGFKEDKYCYRKQKLDSGQQCDEWRENKELFGCYKGKKGKGGPQSARLNTESNGTATNTTEGPPMDPSAEENPKTLPEVSATETVTEGLKPDVAVTVKPEHSKSACFQLIPSIFLTIYVFFGFAFDKCILR